MRALRGLLSSLRLLPSLLLLGGCALPMEPLPGGAVPFEPDASVWRAWWEEVEACSGRRGIYAAVDWFVVPGDAAFEWDGREVNGLWMSRGSRIILAEWALTQPRIVRHEMLHALLRVDGHPPEYFEGRCAALVA